MEQIVELVEHDPRWGSSPREAGLGTSRGRRRGEKTESHVTPRKAHILIGAAYYQAEDAETVGGGRGEGCLTAPHVSCPPLR